MNTGGISIYNVINLVLLLAAAAVFLRKPIRKFFVKKSADIKKKKLDAEKNFQEAREKHDELSGRLGKIQDEIKELIKRAGLEGEKDAGRLLLEAEKLAERIISQSLTRADSEIKRKNKEYMIQIINESIDQAEKTLKETIKLNEQIKLTRAFLKNLQAVDLKDVG